VAINVQRTIVFKNGDLAQRAKSLVLMLGGVDIWINSWNPPVRPGTFLF
jgi:hypothetical protein